MLQEWLAEVSVAQAAAQLGVTRAYLSRILHGHAGISADMALRLSDLLGTSAELWLGMQSAYDLWQAAQQPRALVQRMTVAAEANASLLVKKPTQLPGAHSARRIHPQSVGGIGYDASRVGTSLGRFGHAHLVSGAGGAPRDG